MLFSLDTSYFKKNSNIDHLFVNSAEGLRIRDEPSLSGNKIGVLYDRMSVKVLSVGNETEIDGIKSNWIKILLPIETMKNEENVFGWVFGGYLTNELKPFSTEEWADSDLQRYLCRFSWIEGSRAYLKFDLDGKFSMNLLESGFGGYGKYYTSMKEKTITIKASYGDEDFQSEMKTNVYNIINIEEDKLTLISNNKKIDFRPAFTHILFWGNISKNNKRIETLEENAYTALLFSFAKNMIESISSSNLLKKISTNLVIMGIRIEDEEYMKIYHSYWNQ